MITRQILHKRLVRLICIKEQMKIKRGSLALVTALSKGIRIRLQLLTNPLGMTMPWGTFEVLLQWCQDGCTINKLTLF